MLDRLLLILTRWPFIVALAVLLLNDWWLKSQYPGVITGKLSDFSGLAVVAMLLLTAFPSRTATIYIIVSSAFLWWKSEASEPFIGLVNTWATFQVGRTVDYTDLIALVVLPACPRILAYSSHNGRLSIAQRRTIFIPVVVVTLLGVMGTSVVRTHQEYVVRSIDASNLLRPDAIAKAIATVAASHGLKCRDCSHELQRADFEGNGINLAYSFQAKNSISFTIQAYPNGLFFGASGQEKANALRNSLKAILAQRFQGLEYVEQLKP